MARERYKFQAVLQFAASSIADYDLLVRFEAVLAEHLMVLAYVDGHGRSDSDV